MKEISAEEAEKNFLLLLAGVEAGQEIVITRDNKRVALISPCPRVPTAAEREAARKRLQKRWSRGYHLGGKPMSRDEMYERRKPPKSE